MISIYIVLIIIYCHWIADFVLQDEKWATSKGTDMVALLKHVTVYSMFWVIPGIFFFPKQMILFILITFVCHFLTDWITSTNVKYKFEKGHLGSKIPNFGAFTVIGFDQFLHLLQLILTYKFLVL